MEKPGARIFVLPDDIPLHELDKRYFAYAATLKPPLNKLACDKQLFTGEGKSRQITSLQEVYPLTTWIPWLFKEAFPTVSETDLLDIAEAGALLILALLVQDHYLDGQLSLHPEIPLLHQQLHTAALRKFHILFEAQSPFWTYFDHYFCQYTEALVQETYEHRGRVTLYSIEKMLEIGSGKSALFKTIATALALKAGARTDIPRLEAALDAFAAATQLGDDGMDLEDDYQNQNYTLPLTQAIPDEQWPTPTLTMKEIDQRLENSVILETLMIQVIKWFQQARDAVADLPCPRWVEFVEFHLAFSERYQRALVAKKLLKLLETIPREKS